MVKKYMTVFFTFFFIFLFTIIIMFIYMSGGNLSQGSADFIARGKEAGLSSKEIKTLKKTADILNLDRPLTLLGSIKNIDNAITELNSKLKSLEFKDIDTIDLLEELYAYRKRIELEKMERRVSIKSSREISISQQVKITVGNIETPIIGIVTENNTNNLTVKIQSETAVKPGINWNGPINVYFWKQNDAGYYFESVIGECVSSKIWKIAHSNNLIRSQKRESIRKDLNINAYVYKLENITKKNNRPEGFTGIFTQLKNISEGGAAFLISGHMEVGTPLKIEFEIDNTVVVVCGIVKESNLNKSNNISYTRIRLVEPDFEALTVIRSFIYNNKESKVVELNEEIINNDTEEEVSEVEFLPETM